MRQEVASRESRMCPVYTLDRNRFAQLHARGCYIDLIGNHSISASVGFLKWKIGNRPIGVNQNRDSLQPTEAAKDNRPARTARSSSRCVVGRSWTVLLEGVGGLGRALGARIG